MNLDLVNALDELRDAYELCKQQVYPELQSRLMRIRRMLVEGLHEILTLYDENADLRQLLREAHCEIRQLRASGVPMAQSDRNSRASPPNSASAASTGQSCRRERQDRFITKCSQPWDVRPG